MNGCDTFRVLQSLRPVASRRFWSACVALWNITVTVPRVSIRLSSWRQLMERGRCCQIAIGHMTNQCPPPSRQRLSVMIVRRIKRQINIKSCDVLCTTVGYIDMHAYKQFLQVTVDLGYFLSRLFWVWNGSARCYACLSAVDDANYRR